MPSLHVFGRRWTIASDDFVFPEITEATVRFIWFVTALAIYLTHAKGDSNCAKLHAFMITSLVMNAIVITLAISTAYISSLGTILNATPRRRIPLLIYFRCPLVLFEFVWNIVGAVWTTQQWSQCDSAFLVGVTITVIGGWLMFFLVVLGVCINFDPLGNFHHSDYRLNDKMRKVWKRRIRVACFCASRSDKAKIAFEDVAELMTDFFGDTDLVWTDVCAAMVLLANKEMRVLNDRVRRHPSEDVPAWMNLQLASRMIDFSLGIYGWPYYIYGRSCSPKAVYDLVRKLRCCSGCRCDNVIVIKDNCCLCNTAALLLHTGIQEMDLFYVNLHNEVWETPFVACFDHQSRAIVISIRGSLSLRDVITDLSMVEDSFQLNTCSNENDVAAGTNNANCITLRVHKGMLSSARYVLSKLESEKILDDMFVLQPDYELIITGHSLGAGVATIASLLLKPMHPNVKCFAFSPPGCVISDEAVEFTQDFVCSIVVGDDLVPRLSMHSMKALKQNVLDVLQNYDRPKFEILLKGCFKLLCGGQNRVFSGAESAGGYANHTDVDGDEDVERRLPEPIIVDRQDDVEPLISSRRRVPSYTEVRNNLASGGSENGSLTGGSIPLRCPGRILHILPSAPGDRSSSFSSRWINCAHISDVVMSSSMVNDHMPWMVSKILKDLAVQL